MMNEKEKYVVVATKVKPEANERLDRLAQKKGLSKYELIQMVCDTLIRYMDDQHNLTAEMEQAMSIFEHMTGWKEAFNLADPTTDPEIQEATYFLGTSGRKGFRAVHVFRPFFGQAEQTENIQQIIERVISLITPERYRRLRMLAVEMDCNSLLELLDRMIDMMTSDVDLQAIRETFEDNDRGDYGQKPAGQRFVSTHATSIEKFEND